MSAPLELVLSRLKGVARNGDGFIALCPAHNDQRPSISVKDGETGVVLHCHAGCETQAILTAIGLTPRELFFVPGSKRERDADRPRLLRVVATYPYVDENGTVLFEVLRLDPKGFKQRKPDGGGGYVHKLGDIRRVPYRLPELLAADDVLILEGEKDCETARTLGFVSTCNSGGAGKWRDEYSPYFKGKNVTIVPDADTPGRKHAAAVAETLAGYAASIRVAELPGAKDLTEWLERGGSKEQLHEIVTATVQQNSTATLDGGELLDKIYAFLRRFVNLARAQVVIIVLWIVHTYALDAADVTPYLAITSPEKRCGKTRLLEVLEILVAGPWLTGRATAAVLYRKIHQEHPTLLLDESDAAFGGQRDYAEALRGVLNSGHGRAGKASCCVGQGANITYQDFSTFCAKAIAGIGELPGTVADRSIPIRLQRQAIGEKVERFRLRNVEGEASLLREAVVKWTGPMLSDLRAARPNLPSELTDRQQDGVEPLLAIADAAGGEWPITARQALKEICTSEQPSDESIGVTLLGDIRTIFDAQSTDRLASATLVSFLIEIETSPWSEWKNGKPMTVRGLAKELRRFEIRPTSVRIGEKTPKGYERSAFRDAFQRYVPATSATPLNSHDLAPDSSRNTEPTVADNQRTNPNGISHVADVADNAPAEVLVVVKIEEDL
jgi:hypothetical protein